MDTWQAQSQAGSLFPAAAVAAATVATMLVAPPGQWSLFLCAIAGERAPMAPVVIVRQHAAASTIFGAASTPVAAAGVIISAPASSSSVGLWRSGDGL